MADQIYYQTDDTITEASLQDALARQNSVDYVQDGLGFTVDYATPALDVSTGIAHLLVGPSQGITVSVDARSGLSLTDSDVNHVYLDVDVSNDTISIVINTTGSAPSGTTLKLGTVDTSADTKDEINREPAVAARELTGPVVGNATVTSLTGTNLNIVNGVLESSGAAAAVSDDGTQVLASPSDLNFGTNVSVTDDGDGTVTVDVSDQATSDTRVNVSDDGTQVVAEPADINFSTDLTVTDDGDGTVTVDAAQTSAADIENDGTTIVTAADAINFASALSVTDDGDNTVTVDNDVSLVIKEGGTSLVTNPDDINFGRNITAQDDGDGTVTVSASAAKADVSDNGTTVVTGADDVDYGAGLTASDDGDGTATVDFDQIQDCIERPHAVRREELADGEILDFGVAVPDGQTLKIHLWGVRDNTGSTPTGLEAVLLDASRTVQASENTARNANATGAVASLTNSSGSLSYFFYGIRNSTGSDYLASDGNWVTGTFGRRVN